LFCTVQETDAEPALVSDNVKVRVAPQVNVTWVGVISSQLVGRVDVAVGAVEVAVGTLRDPVGVDADVWLCGLGDAATEIPV
jgi:hypothetical protein